MNEAIETSKSLDIVKTISEQLGAKTFFMLGAKNKGYGTDNKGNTYISFKIRGSKNVSHIKITYNEAMDLYDMEFGKVRKYEYKIINTVNSVYNDMLNQIIESNTGLYTRL